MKLNKFIDHTALKVDCKESAFRELCKQAIENEFYSVCVNPARVPFCKQELAETPVKLCSVVGFPLGAHTTATKVFETQDLITMGCDEIDMVINVQALLDENLNFVRDDIAAVLEEVRKSGKVLKVIIEAALLNESQIQSVALICKELTVDYVKTSTGFQGGASVATVRQLKSILGDEVKIKASGGIKTKADAIAMIDAGADRLGTSNSVNIVGP